MAGPFDRAAGQFNHMHKYRSPKKESAFFSPRHRPDGTGLLRNAYQFVIDYLPGNAAVPALPDYWGKRLVLFNSLAFPCSSQTIVTVLCTHGSPRNCSRGKNARVALTALAVRQIQTSLTAGRHTDAQGDLLRSMSLYLQFHAHPTEAQ